MRRHFLLVTAVVSALTMTGCAIASDSDAADSVPTTEPPQSTTPAPTTSAVPVPTAPPSTTEAQTFTRPSDVVYLSAGDVDLPMGVFQPVGDGPWPVVVSFHGLSSDGKDSAETVAVAEQAAAAGMLVFTPTWIAGDSFPPTLQTLENWDDTIRCAVAFSQEVATRYGGDPTVTVVEGFSAGAGAALAVASLTPQTAPIDGCIAASAPTPVAGFVLGDGEYTLHSEHFDAVFETDLEEMQARLTAYINPESWPIDRATKFYLWAAEEGTRSRAIDDPNSSGWYQHRDPDGSIRADLERLDEFDDGSISYVDAAKLVALRLSEAGFDVTLDEYPGGHTTANKVVDIVGYLRAAAG